jgi:hypothetical protein
MPSLERLKGQSAAAAARRSPLSTGVSVSIGMILAPAEHFQDSSVGGFGDARHGAARDKAIRLHQSHGEKPNLATRDLEIFESVLRQIAFPASMAVNPAFALAIGLESNRSSPPKSLADRNWPCMTRI